MESEIIESPKTVESSQMERYAVRITENRQRRVVAG